MARVAGKQAPRTAHLRQSGAMRTAPGKRWLPLQAEQWFSLDPPGFLWRGAISPSPLLRIAAVDRGIQARRYRVVGKRFELTPWLGRSEDYREANGILIPHRIAVTWGLPQGDFEWLRASLDEIQYS